MVCVPVFHLKDAEEAQHLADVLKKLCKKNSCFELEAVVVKDKAAVMFYHRVGASTLTPSDYKSVAKRAEYCSNLVEALEELDPEIYQKIIVETERK
jgi:hypothetical protein